MQFTTAFIALAAATMVASTPLARSKHAVPSGAAYHGQAQLSPIGADDQCLSVLDANSEQGSPVGLNGCDSDLDSTWEIIPGANTQVQLVGTNLCLDASSSPANGVAMKLWTCDSALPQQNWWFTSDGRLAITGGNQCLDQAAGTNSQVQVWQCTPGDAHQAWQISESIQDSDWFSWW